MIIVDPSITPDPDPKDGGSYNWGSGGSGDDEGEGGGNSGGDKGDEESEAECLKYATTDYQYCLADADMEHAKRLKSGCALIAGFPIGNGYIACFHFSTALLNANNHSCEVGKTNAEYACKNP